MNVKSIFNKIKFKAVKNSPTICVVGGVIGVIGGAILACKATLKVPDIKEEHEKNLESLSNIKENEGVADENVTMTEEEIKKETRKEYIRFGLRLVKLYAAPVLIEVVSITSILFGHSTLKKRNVSLAAAYATLDKGYKEYRKRVVEKYGEDVDKELRYDLKKVTETVETVGEDGKKKKEKVTKYESGLSGYSEYARFFDCGNNGWDDDPEVRLFFLRMAQDHFNDRLKARGYVFLNEVYEYFGMPITKAGQAVGWRYDLKNPTGDNQIDFGIYDVRHPRNGDFIDGYCDAIILDFNVDGPIVDYVTHEKLK